MQNFWNTLYDKVKGALLVAIPIDAVYVLAWVNGTTTWRVALVGAVATDIPVIVAWCVKESRLPKDAPVEQVQAHVRRAPVKAAAKKKT